MFQAMTKLQELKTHLRGALNLGWTVDALRVALLQTAPYAGFSAANEALQALSATVPTHERSRP